MKKIVTLLGIGLICLSLNTFAGNYKIDQSKIDAMIENATDVTAVAAYDLSEIQALPIENAMLDEKDPIVAFALATFLGPLGIHRLYLGTKPVTFVLYLITFGGFGIVSGVDWIFLLLALIDDSRGIGAFIDNPKFIMWMDSL